MDNLTVIVPFYNGHKTIERLLDSIPSEIPILIVDDLSDEYYESTRGNVGVIRLVKKGYFAGAVNRGIQTVETDVLILNQDTWFDSGDWLETIESLRGEYAFFGERIRGNHPAFGELGYVHGTFLFIRRDAIREVGLLNEKLYPLWGNTAEYQWRVARKDYKIFPIEKIPGFHHERAEGVRFGSSIQTLLEREPQKKNILVQTPPLVSVIVPCYNYGRYLHDCVASLIGGFTSLGKMPGQTLQSLEIIIVDDASTDNSMEYIRNVADIRKGIRAYHLEKNVGTARALNFGIEKAVGKYITFLSADDMRESDSIEKLVEACENNPHSFAYDDVWIFNGHKRIKKWQIEEYDFDKLIWKNQIHAGILYPRVAWVETGGYPPAMSDGREDWAFNVALGVYGWCGVHVKEFGYLYRREGQNRTETNTTETHRQRFLSKIMDLFPDIYKGYRPMACCGKGGSNNKKNIGVNSSLVTRNGVAMESAMIGSVGMEKIEYLGDQMTFTAFGETTNAAYTFGRDRPKGWVDKRDVGSRESGKGFLGKKDRRTGTWMYRLAETSKNVFPVEEVKVEEVEVEEVKVEVEKLAEPAAVEKAAPVGAAQVSGSLSAKEKLDFPDPTDMNVEEIKALELSREQWVEVYKTEMARRNRKGAIAFMEDLLANWQDD